MNRDRSSYLLRLNLRPMAKASPLFLGLDLSTQSIKALVIDGGDRSVRLEVAVTFSSLTRYPTQGTFSTISHLNICKIILRWCEGRSGRARNISDFDVGRRSRRAFRQAPCFEPRSQQNRCDLYLSIILRLSYSIISSHFM